LIVGALALALAMLVGAQVPSGARASVALAAGTLTLSPTSGSPGTHIFLTGHGFTPGESVEIIWNYTGPGTGIIQKSFYEYNPTVAADTTGAANTSFWVSASHAGAYTVALQGLTSGAVATATFTLTPSVEIGTYVGPTGTTLRLRGWAFAAKESVAVYWNYQQSGQVVAAKASTDSKGDWSGRTFVVPLGATSGAHTVAAVGAISKLVATTQYTVGAPPSGPGAGASDWANFGYSLQNTRANPTETTISVGNVSTLAQKWATSTLVTPYKILGSPVVVNGVAYIGTIQGYALAYKLSAPTSPLWTFSAQAPIYGSPTFANGILYFGTVKNTSEDTTGNYLYALNASTGALIWKNFLTQGSVWAPPTVSNGVVYVTTALKEATSGTYMALHALTGATVWSDSTMSGNWSVPTLDPRGGSLFISTGNPCLSSPPPPQNTPLTDGCSGSVYDVSSGNGKTVWSYHFPDYTGDDDAPASPDYAVYNGTAFILEGVKNGIFYCLHAPTGALAWQFDTGNRGDTGIYSSAAYANGVVYFGGDKTLYALNIKTGSAAWTQPFPQPLGQIVGSPTIANGVLYVTTESGNLVAYNAATGAQLWRHSFPLAGSKSGAPIYGSPIVSNGVVYIGVSDGYLYAFSPNGK